MISYGKKRDAVRIVRIIVIVLIALVVLFLAKKVYDYLNTEYQMMLYPLTYGEYVEKYAEEFGVNTDLIYAVIKVESNFKTDAVSNVGARGLMQIMEDTFDWIKYRLDDETSEYSDMFDAEMNIRYGTYLLSYNLGYFNDLTCAIAAYHAGTAGVEKWLGNGEYSRDGKTLDKIPTSDTEHYVDKVERANAKYIQLYNHFS